MFAEHKNEIEMNEEQEFDYYLEWDWPEHIETALRRMLWISLVETAEGAGTITPHTHMVRWMIANHPDTPAEVLDFMSQFAPPKLLIRIAENPQTSAATLDRLSMHENAEVRLAVADHRATPINTLMKLASSTDADVRYCMAENPSLPAKLLQQLAADANVYISARAKRTMMRRNPAAVHELPARRHANSDKKAM